jgi:hypothetical protein
MGIAGFSRSPVLLALLSPIQALASLLQPAPPAARSPVFPAPRRSPSANHRPLAGKEAASNVRPASAMVKKPCQTVAKAASPRRLKIVREFEAGISPSCAGRMVISGRMADVCAELDRMAQREATTHPV